MPPQNTSPRRSMALRAIVLAGSIAGTMDITAAIVVYGRFGVKPIPLLQGIAAGILGPRAGAGGLPSALLGLVLEFVISCSAAAVYFAFSRKFRFLVKHAVAFGILYGIAVYFFMNRIVVPLSRARKYQFSFELMVIGVAIHILCIGLPIALSVRFSSE
jgi:hypothetical protein